MSYDRVSLVQSAMNPGMESFTYAQTLLNKPCVLVRTSIDIKLNQLTPFIIRYMLVSQDTLGSRINDLTYLRQTADVVVSCVYY